MDLLNRKQAKYRLQMLKPLSFAPAAAVMAVIFYFSSADGEVSSSQSLFITRMAVDIAGRVLKREWDLREAAALAAQWDFYIRKLAHFSEYALLGATLVPPLFIYNFRGKRLFFAGWSWCAAYAVFDECHQIFSAGRTPGAMDVAIDAFGAAAGISFMIVILIITGRGNCPPFVE